VPNRRHDHKSGGIFQPASLYAQKVFNVMTLGGIGVAHLLYRQFNVQSNGFYPGFGGALVRGFIIPGPPPVMWRNQVHPGGGQFSGLSIKIVQGLFWPNRKSSLPVQSGESVKPLPSRHDTEKRHDSSFAYHWFISVCHHVPPAIIFPLILCGTNAQSIMLIDNWYLFSAEITTEYDGYLVLKP